MADIVEHPICELKCGCRHPDAQECMRRRYAYLSEDDEHEDDAACECDCHYGDEDGITGWDRYMDSLKQKRDRSGIAHARDREAALCAMLEATLSGRYLAITAGMTIHQASHQRQKIRAYRAALVTARKRGAE